MRDEEADEPTRHKGDDDDEAEPLPKVTAASQKSEEPLQAAEPKPIDSDDDDTAEDSKDNGAVKTQQQVGDDVDDAATVKAGQKDGSPDDASETQEQQQKPRRGLLSGAQGLAGKASGLFAKGARKPSKETAEETKKATKEEPSPDLKETATEAQDQGRKVAGETTDEAADSDTPDDDDDDDEAEAPGVGESGEHGPVSAETADPAIEKAVDSVHGSEDGLDDEVEQQEKSGERDLGDNVKETIKDEADVKDDDNADAPELPSKEGISTDAPQLKELPLDLSPLKGLEVGEDGNVLNQEGNAIGRLAEGDAEDLAGYPIGDDGEILDEDGDLVGRVELLPAEIKRQLQALRSKGEQLPASADQYLEQPDDEEPEADDAEDAEDADNAALPSLTILEGLTCAVDGLIYDDEGNTVGKVVEGDAEELQNCTLNDQGEFVDDDGNVVGRADLHEDTQELVEQGVYEARQAIDAAGHAEDVAEEQTPDTAAGDIEDQLPGIEALQGKELNEAGEIVDDEGNVLGGIEDADLKQKIVDGKVDTKALRIDDQGQVVDDKGEVLGNVGLAEGAAEKLAQKSSSAVLDFRILEKKRINKKGQILDDDGEVIGELLDGDLKACTGQRVNDKGEVLDKKSGDVVGHVRVVPGEAAETATKELLEDLGETTEQARGAVAEDHEEAGSEGAVQDIEEPATEEETPEDAETPTGEDEEQETTPSVLEGLKVNKKGQVLNEDGEPVGELTSGQLSECAGQKINGIGEVLNSKGKVIGHVRTLPSAKDEPDISTLEGLKVNKKGQVLNEDGELIGELTSGDGKQCAGKKINDKGEVLDNAGNVIGSVRTTPLTGDDEAAAEEEEQAAEVEGDEEDSESQLPPLSTLEGLKVNKSGKIINTDGIVVGELVEGNAKKLWKAGTPVDAEGQFWDNKGHVIGRAQTVPLEDAEDEAPFAGLDGLHVVEDGYVQDDNGNTVGIVTEGDAKKLIGRIVDEDGDIIDKRGSVVGHADRYEPEETPEEEAVIEEKPDLSFLQGKSVTKAGLVIGDEGVPVARLVEGNAKELSGRKLDDQGQLWNDRGKVTGRVELIPESEREQKAEGPFAGLEDLRVIEGGKVADEDGNVVGEIVEGNPRRLVGLSVDEDGDIVDKYGNVKGHAEPVPEEAATDYSILDGLTVNKQGYVVDQQGMPVGKLVEGNSSELAGKKCDENGLVYGDRGKVAGRCEPLPENERTSRKEGPFAGLEGLRVVKGGKVEDADGNVVGEVTEGDPKRLAGLAVDEDGDIIDKFGNAKGHAEPLVEEDEAPVDNRPLEGKTLNKQGFVVDDRGIPFGKLIEGVVSELSGRKCDENGFIHGDTGKVVGRCEVLPENERVARPEGPFAGLEGLRVVKGGKVEDDDGNVVGEITEGDPKRLVGSRVDEDGDIIDKYGNVKGHAEPWSEEEPGEIDLSRLDGTTINKAGYAVDGSGQVIGRVVEGDQKVMVGKKVDGKGQIWDGSGKVIGKAELAYGIDKEEGPFAGFEGLKIQRNETVTTQAGDIIGRIVEGDIKKLLGHTVDEDGDITDENGNTIGKAERWEPDEKERRANPMSGRRVNKLGEVRDDNGDVMGRLTAGDLGHCVGQEIDDAGNVVDVDGNKIGEVTLLENIVEEEYEGPTEEQLAEAAKREEENEIAKKMIRICDDTLERIRPVCKQINDLMEEADRTPKDELDEEKLVDKVKPLIEEGGRILQECNGALRGLDPDGHIAAQAKGRSGAGEATPEEYRLADVLKELTTTVVTCIDGAKKKLNHMPHARKKLNPLWGLLTQPLFQILAAVGLLLTGVLGLVGQLLSALGLGSLVNGLLGGLGINRLLTSLGLKEDPNKGRGRGGGSNPLGNLPVIGGLLGGNK